jgi:hypothetical protein
MPLQAKEFPGSIFNYRSQDSKARGVVGVILFSPKGICSGRGFFTAYDLHIAQATCFAARYGNIGVVLLQDNLG